MKQKLKSEVATPVFSWSPLPPRKKLDFTQKNQVRTSKNESNDANEKPYYPNCEFQVWLRSCEEEIIEPIQGEFRGKTSSHH